MIGSDSIFLVGPMGAGKSTIGRLLAAELHLPFIDADKEIEQRCGADIAWIFDVEGEEGFRDRESAILEELTARSGIVLATGGGAVIRPENRRNLVGRGLVVYLQASVKQQLRRTARDKDRPLLQKGNPEQTLRALADTRGPFYREVADLMVETDGQSPREVARQLAEQIRSRA